MEDVNIIYKNDVGLSFIWKRGPVNQLSKVNLVINDMALHLTKNEVLRFSSLIDIALKRSITCHNCEHNRSCKSFLLESPIPQISFVMSYKEILSIQDLVKGTLFELGLDSLLKEIL